MHDTENSLHTHHLRRVSLTVTLAIHVESMCVSILAFSHHVSMMYEQCGAVGHTEAPMPLKQPRAAGALTSDRTARGGRNSSGIGRCSRRACGRAVCPHPPPLSGQWSAAAPRHGFRRTSGKGSPGRATTRPVCPRTCPLGRSFRPPPKRAPLRSRPRGSRRPAPSVPSFFATRM